MTSSDIPANTSNRVIPVNFTSGNRGRILDDNNSDVNQLGRPRVEELSKKNDSFEELATRLTDFFSKSESQNDQAQEIKNACWNDLTDDKKPVFEPDFSNLKNAQFSKSSEGLTITLSPEHVNEGYLQVLSDLTLVAEVIKRLIDNRTEDGITGFNAHPVENIKIITHPERNLVIQGEKITRNLNYQIGPEFKFIQSKTYGLIPVANGMFNRDDVREGKLGTVNKDNTDYLEKFAFNGEDSLNDPLSHLYDFNRSYLTPQNKIFILPPENRNMKGFKAVMDGYGYGSKQAELEEWLSKHNRGPIIDNSEGNQADIQRTIKISNMDSIYKKRIRETAKYEPSGNNIFRPRHQDHVALNPAAASMLEIDGLTLQGRNGISPLKTQNDSYVTTEYAERNQKPRVLDAIYR
jgi:hypothetical protein